MTYQVTSTTRAQWIDTLHRGDTKQSSVTATVIICTRNRAAALDRALASLAAMRVPGGLPWEVVVVDNGSSDETPHVLARWRTALPLRVTRERRPGHAVARNAGLRAARGEILLLTDDDCVVDPDWLAVACAEFERNPRLGLIGGRVELLDPTDLPMTIRTMRERSELRSIHQLTMFIIGCNLVLTRQTCAAIGIFDTALGGGTRSGSGEDTDYVYRAFRTGIPVVYIPELVVYHGHGRRTADDAARIRSRYARGRGAVYAKYLWRGDRGMWARAHADAVALARRAADDMRQGRFPADVARHVWHMLAGAVGWLTTRRR